MCQRMSKQLRPTTCIRGLKQHHAKLIETLNTGDKPTTQMSEIVKVAKQSPIPTKVESNRRNNGSTQIIKRRITSIKEHAPDYQGDAAGSGS